MTEHVSHVGYFLILCRIEGTKLHRYVTISLFSVNFYPMLTCALCGAASLPTGTAQAMHVSHPSKGQRVLRELCKG